MTRVEAIRRVLLVDAPEGEVEELREALVALGCPRWEIERAEQGDELDSR